jgi:pyruvate,water dikinase
MIDRLRMFAGYREYPKYAIISRNFVYKQALMNEAERLVRAGVLQERDDVLYLRFEELEDAVRTGHVDQQLIR